MSRALFESTLDPFLFLYNFLSLIRDDINYEIWIYFSLVVFSLFILLTKIGIFPETPVGFIKKQRLSRKICGYVNSIIKSPSVGGEKSPPHRRALEQGNRDNG